MCGICLILSFRTHPPAELTEPCDGVSFKDLLITLKRRGPDDFQKVDVSYDNAIDLVFVSSVLHLRGSSLESQPAQDGKGNTLLWNGEIFDGPLIPCSQSDTKFLSDSLFSCTKIDDVVNVIGSIYGPYAFIFYQNSGLLWFGRDILGRRSLLFSVDDTSFNICSVAYGASKWQEVPTTGLFCLDLSKSQSNGSFVTYHFPWSTTASGLSSFKKEYQMIHSKLILQTKFEHLVNSPILKSLNRSLPSSETGGYLNLKIEGTCLEHKNILLLLQDVMIKKVLKGFEDVLSESVRKRVQNQPLVCKNCYGLKSSNIPVINCNHACIGILFSGGLDSIVIAALAHRHLPESVPIDLLNVAFANKSSLSDASCLKGNLAFNTPDRLTGRSGVTALKDIFPTRSWNFIEVNVSEQELVAQRSNIISQLIKPSCTVLDDSIGCAIWFAAHGDGNVTLGGGCTDYKSPARIMLLGMGADEQLGGYSRHRAIFTKFGWSGLIDEISMELDRIGCRNLGRDDRIIADNSVESRYPFLDENVVSFLNELPIWLKVNLNLPRGLGEKLILRLLAFKIGLTDAAVLPKRAIQFGSRIARIENSKEKGSDICERLMNSL